MSTEIKKYLDIEGLQHLWSKINMQDYPNNDILIKVIDAIDKNKADKDEIDAVDEKVEALGQLVGDASIPEQIQSAMDELHVIAKTGSWNDLEDKPNQDDALRIAAETGLIELVVADNGSIYTDDNGYILTLI